MLNPNILGDGLCWVSGAAQCHLQSTTSPADASWRLETQWSGSGLHVDGLYLPVITQWRMGNTPLGLFQYFGG